MAHTYTNLLLHGVFSTKHRLSSLRSEYLPELSQVVGGIIKKRSGRLLAMNGPCDHVHLLLVSHPSIATADLFRDIKAISSDWIHDKCRDLTFAWQTGYSAFSVSQSRADEVERYIARQQMHHKKLTFEEELTALLERNGIEYDKRYVFD